MIFLSYSTYNSDAFRVRILISHKIIIKLYYIRNVASGIKFYSDSTLTAAPLDTRYTEINFK